MKIIDKFYYYPEKGMLDCNTYLLKDEMIVVVDPGSGQYLPELIEDIRKDGIDPGSIDIIVNTHLHLDHYAACQEFKDTSGAKIALHPLQKKYFDISGRQISRLFGINPIELEEDILLNDKLNTGKLGFEIISVPGHSLDSISYYSRDEGVLICGDLIFKNNTGRVDFPGGDTEELKRSIERIAELGINYLLPGHMEIVQGKEAVKSNFDYVRQHVFSWL